MPLVAKQMHNMAIIRSMSTREADHMRGRYYMHTGYVPSTNMEHPSYGSVPFQPIEEGGTLLYRNSYPLGAAALVQDF